MAITALNDYAIGDIDLTAIVNTLDKTYKGKADITISAYDTTAAPTIKVGSVFECNGALYIVDTTDITPTGYSGISVSTTFYLYYDESAGAFIYSSTAPTWNDALQGHYNGNDRAFFSMYKDSGGTLYESKSILVKTHILQTKVIEIGSWNMDVDQDKLVLHGISDHTKILSISVAIYKDDLDSIYYLTNVSNFSTISSSGLFTIAITPVYGTQYVILQRTISGKFDEVNFNDTAINRGYITIWYVA